MTNDAPKRVVLHWDNPKLDNGWEGWWHVCEGANGPGIGWYIHEDQAQAELKAAVAAEREACAEVAANFFDQQAGRVIAEIIRNRSKGGQ